MSEYVTIARPYAKAAFDFAIEHKQLDHWQNMLFFTAEVSQNEAVANMLSDSLAPQKIAEIFIKVCDEQLDEYGQNFIRILAENKRLSSLPDVFKQFVALVDEYQSIADVEVISACPLSEKQQQSIIESMEKRLSRKVKLNCSIDKSIIAGAIIRTDDFVIDGSSRGQLSRLATSLQL